jgi:phage terminase large subunit
LQEAGFYVEVVPNQGRGAAISRIEEARRLFPRMIFNETRVEGGLAALRYYHAKIDEVRNIDLGPDHDWSSHCADAFGLMAVFYEEPRANEDVWDNFDMDWVV